VCAEHGGDRPGECGRPEGRRGLFCRPGRPADRAAPADIRERAKRRLVAHPKFYLFDAGVFQAIRPRGPLDAADEIRGAALETLFLQQLRAVNDYLGLGYSLHYWRTAAGDEVDFVLYGPRGLVALEVKATARMRPDDLGGLRRLREDYPLARAFLVYTGSRQWHERGIEIVPAGDALRALADLLG
jgi:predicted AAA+ superfamily ATPase